MAIIASLLVAVLSMLPPSPFQSMITALEDSQLLSTLNWFIPFGPVVAMLETWAVCMALFYSYRAVKNVIDIIIQKLVS